MAWESITLLLNPYRLLFFVMLIPTSAIFATCIFLQLVTFGFIIASRFVTFPPPFTSLGFVLLVSNFPTHIPESSLSPNVNASGVLQLLTPSLTLYCPLPVSFTLFLINLTSISPGNA